MVDALPSGPNAKAQWLLAHSFDGVVWGKRSGSQWTFATSQVDACTVTSIRRTHLLELRLFDTHSETLIWRSGETFLGRIIEDSDGSLPSWAEPMNEIWAIVGDRLISTDSNSFSLVRDARGSSQYLPFSCSPMDFLSDDRRGISPFRLGVRHYLEQDSEDGSVRIAASRLVNLFMENRP
jgi:CRISPR-associated protein (TIGR03984 family)